MSIEQLDTLLARFATLTSHWSAATPLDAMRGDLERFYGGYEEVVGTRIELVNAGGVPAEHVRAPGASDSRWLLILHGGGFSTGSARAHRAFASHLSAASNCQCLTIDYRLAPEHLYPAALDDAVAAYRWLLAKGIAPADLAISGDSAGGGLAIGLMLRLRDMGVALPGCAILLSPWADLACDGDSYIRNAAIDPIATREMAIGMAATYLGPDIDPRLPLVSPIGADLAGMPPIMLQAGEREIFLDDARTLHERLVHAGVPAELDIVPGMIHQFQLHVGHLDESSIALGALGAFLRRHASSP